MIPHRQLNASTRPVRAHTPGRQRTDRRQSTGRRRPIRPNRTGAHRDESSPAPRTFRDRGQATTEYALVMLGAALVGVLVIGWATSGGGAAAINRLFDSVIDSVLSNV